MNGQMTMHTHYDRVGDVLYLSLGSPQAALTRTDEADDRINWRVSFEGRTEVIGVTVLDYSSWERMALFNVLCAKLPLAVSDLPEV